LRVRVTSERTTAPIVVVIGGDAIVGQTLELLLQSADCSVRFLAEPPLRDPGLLDNVELLILAPGLDAERREGTLELIGGLAAAKIPILELVAGAGTAALTSGRLVSWPCRAQDLQRYIKVALHSKPRADTDDQTVRATYHIGCRGGKENR
jgi:hypothetical protein